MEHLPGFVILAGFGRVERNQRRGRIVWAAFVVRGTPFDRLLVGHRGGSIFFLLLMPESDVAIGVSQPLLRKRIESQFLGIGLDGFVPFAIRFVGQTKPVKRQEIFGVLFGGLLEIQGGCVEP